MSVWDSAALIVRSDYYGLADDPKYATVTYTIMGDDSLSVTLGDLVPVQIQAAPKSGDGEVIVLDEAGKRNSSSDAGQLNAALRSLMAMMSEDDMDEETWSMMTDKMKKKKKKVMGEAEEVDEEDDLATEAQIQEAWKDLPGETFNESFLTIIEAGSFDKKSLTIKDSVMLGPVSSNGYDYPSETQKKAIPLFEGCKAYLNHPKLEDMKEARDVRDLIGEHRNVHQVGEHLKSDIHLINNTLVRETLIPIIESKPHLIGNSVVVRGKKATTQEGRQFVEEIYAVRSVDIVSEPATTKGLFTEAQKQEDAMEWKDVTADRLKAERPDVYEAIVKPLTDQVTEAKTAESAAKTALDAAKTDLTKTNEQLKETSQKLMNVEVEIAAKKKNDLIGKVVLEAKIPDDLKYEEKDGVKQIKGHLRTILEHCPDEKEMKTVMEGFEAVAKVKPTSNGKSVEDTTVVTEASMGRFINALQ